MKKTTIFLLAMLMASALCFGQKQPFNFPTKSPTDSDFIPTQIKTGANYFGRRINFPDAKAYFLDLATALDGDGDGNAKGRLDSLVMEMTGVRLASATIVSGNTLRLTFANGSQLNVVLPGGAGVTDGDKGDITVTSTGAIWTVDNDAITAAKIATAAVGTDEVANGSLQNGDMATMPNNTFKGNVSGAPTAPSDLTVAQMKTALAIAPADVIGFDEAVEDKIGAKVIAGANVTVTYNDATGETTVAASGGGGGGDPAMGGDLSGTASNAQLNANVVGTAEIAPGGVGTTDVADAAITWAKLQSAAANTFLARAAGTSGAVAEVSVASSRLLGRAATGDIGAISLGPGLAFSGSTVKTANRDSLYAVANTLYLRGTDGNVTSVTITVSFPRDTMWLSGNDLKFAPEGNIALVQTLTLPAPVQPITTTSSGSTITLNLNTSNVHVVDCAALNRPTILTSNNQAGKWHNLHFKNSNDSVYLSPTRFFWTKSDGKTCPLNWVTTSNFILSGYADANYFNIASSTNTLGCYPFKTQYQNILNQANTLGYTIPNNATQVLQNALVDSLIVNGIWDSLDVFWIIPNDVNCKQFSYLNWKDPSGDDNLSEIGTVTYAAAGWSGDGSTSALNSNWNPSTEGVAYSLNDCSYGAWIVSPGGTGSKFNMGWSNSRMEENSGGRKYQINSSVETTSTGSATTGLWHINRSASGTTNAYLNGSSVASGTAASTSVGNANMFLMALNLSGSPFGSTVSTVKYKCFFAGGNLGAKANKFYTLVNAYLNSI